jgi:hypothetical protein
MRNVFSLTKPSAVQGGAVLTTGRVEGKQDFRQYMVSWTAFFRVFIVYALFLDLDSHVYGPAPS